MASVSDIFGYIKGLLQPAKIYNCYDSKLLIEEKDKQATLKKVTIISVGSSAFSIKYDQCGFPGDKMFSQQAPVHRGCDSITFCEVDSIPYILCLELKSSEPTVNDVEGQFKNADCFLSYLNELLRQNYNVAIDDWIRYRIVFHNQPQTPLAKTPTTYTKLNVPAFIAINNGSSFYLRKLLGSQL